MKGSLIILRRSSDGNILNPGMVELAADDDLLAADAADFIGQRRQTDGESENYRETKNITDAGIVSAREVHIVLLHD
jgi:hypothetical protein